MPGSPTFLERLAHWTRVALIAVIAVILGLIVSTPRNEYPLTMSRAQAEGVSAAPGFLLTSMGISNNDKLVLVDTQKQVVCIYGLTGGQFRLMSARKFDYDDEIVDTSTMLQAGNKNIKIEGGDGISREEAGAYKDKLKEGIEKLEKQGKKPK